MLFLLNSVFADPLVKRSELDEILVKCDTPLTIEFMTVVIAFERAKVVCVASGTLTGVLVLSISSV